MPRFRPLVVAAIVLLALLDAARVQACSCVRRTTSELFKDAIAVFEGRVLSRDEPEDPEGMRNVRVRFSVVRVFKGELGEEVELTTAPHSAACGVRFELEQSYLVFVDGGEPGALHVSLCGGATAMENAEPHLQELGMGATPYEPPATPTPDGEHTSNGDPEPESKPGDAPATRGGCASCSIVGAGRASAGSIAVAASFLLSLLVCRIGRRRRL